MRIGFDHFMDQQENIFRDEYGWGQKRLKKYRDELLMAPQMSAEAAKLVAASPQQTVNDRRYKFSDQQVQNLQQSMNSTSIEQQMGMDRASIIANNEVNDMQLRENLEGNPPGMMDSIESTMGMDRASLIAANEVNDM